MLINQEQGNKYKEYKFFSAISSRMAGFLAGFPDTTTLMSVNRLCSSGLEACAVIASKIRAGIIDLGIGSGVE
jgi:acetyl-CoA acyltransferase 1